MNLKQTFENQGYFEKRSLEEDMPILPLLDVQEKYKLLESLFDELFDDNSLALAKHSSKEERDKRGLNDSSYVYGEITFRSMAYIFEYLKHTFGDTILKGHFYDMGSGIGKAVIAASFLYPFTQCIGIERLEKLHMVGMETKSKFENKFEEMFKHYQDFFPNYSTIPQIEIINDDFLKHNLANASIIFANSTCFSADLMLSLSKKAQQELSPGAIFITFTKRLPNLPENWEIKEGFRRLMSWGIATVYVHRKKLEKIQIVCL